MGAGYIQNTFSVYCVLPIPIHNGEGNIYVNEIKV